MCRVIHALNYHLNNTSKLTHLLVDVHPRLLESVKDDHGQAFENFLDLIGVRTSQVVIQIPAIVNRNWKLLQHVIANYRSRGYQIAANYSGTRSDWMVELGSLYPDIVRIGAYDLLKHESINELIDTVHSFDAKLLAGEIVTSAELAALRCEQRWIIYRNLLSEPQQAIRSIDALPVLETLSSPSIYTHLQQKQQK